MFVSCCRLPTWVSVLKDMCLFHVVGCLLGCPCLKTCVCFMLQAAYLGGRTFPRHPTAMFVWMCCCRGLLPLRLPAPEVSIWTYVLLLHRLSKEPVSHIHCRWIMTIEIIISIIYPGCVWSVDTFDTWVYLIYIFV